MNGKKFTEEDFENAKPGTKAVLKDGVLTQFAFKFSEEKGDMTPWCVASTNGFFLGWQSNWTMERYGWVIEGPQTIEDHLDAVRDLAKTDAYKVDRFEPNEPHVRVYPDGGIGTAEWSEAVVREGLGFIRVPLAPREDDPEWMSADVVEASTEENPNRRLFFRLNWIGQAGWIDTEESVYESYKLVDPVAVEVKKKDE